MKKSLCRDSNSGPPPYQGGALPAEPQRHRDKVINKLFKNIWIIERFKTKTIQKVINGILNRRPEYTTIVFYNTSNTFISQRRHLQL